MGGGIFTPTFNYHVLCKRGGGGELQKKKKKKGRSATRNEKHDT